MTANSKHYAKDLRHLVMLNGFCLQESTVNQPPIPNIPIPTVPTSPQGLSPSQQQTIRPTQNVVVRPPQPQNQPQQRPPVPFGRTSYKILSNLLAKILFFVVTGVSGPTSAPNVTIVNTVPPMMAAEGGVRIRAPNPRWPSPNQGQQLPNQVLQQTQPAQMQATNQVRQPSQIQIPQAMQNPLQQQQQQQQQQAMLQSQQQGPQVLSQNTLPGNQNPLQSSVLQHQQPMTMPISTNPIQQAQAQVQHQVPQQSQAAGQMIINPQQQQLQQQNVRASFGAPQNLVNQLNQGQGMHFFKLIFSTCIVQTLTLSVFAISLRRDVSRLFIRNL
jgi:hypothetical protein